MGKDKKIKNPFLRVDLLFDETIKELKKEIEEEIEEEKAEERRCQKEILRGAIKEK